MQSHDDAVRDNQEEYDSIGEPVYAALMNAKRMGPQLTAKAIALMIQNLYKHQLISDLELDELFRLVPHENPGGTRQKPR